MTTVRNVVEKCRRILEIQSMENTEVHVKMDDSNFTATFAKGETISLSQSSLKNVWEELRREIADAVGGSKPDGGDDNSDLKSCPVDPMTTDPSEETTGFIKGSEVEKDINFNSLKFQENSTESSDVSPTNIEESPGHNECFNNDSNNERRNNDDDNDKYNNENSNDKVEDNCVDTPNETDENKEMTNDNEQVTDDKNDNKINKNDNNDSQYDNKNDGSPERERDVYCKSDLDSKLEDLMKLQDHVMVQMTNLDRMVNTTVQLHNKMQDNLKTWLWQREKEERQAEANRVQSAIKNHPGSKPPSLASVQFTNTNVRHGNERCFECDDSGHMKNECPLKGLGLRKCYECQRFTKHKPYECPQRLSKIKGKFNSAPGEAGCSR